MKLTATQLTGHIMRLRLRITDEVHPQPWGARATAGPLDRQCIGS